ncbi:MAG: DUF262 domain-containing protein [Clostridiales bacterium]|jgi:hypothetical protein|nr:DUF262 domain-containing protein [Clostridiales bacterium]
MSDIGLKSVDELLSMRFFIPRYQRGYRWTEQQVIDLLNDINEFDESKSEFYCLQPLVVKKISQDESSLLGKVKEAKSINKVKELLKETWEVIDGQQRLTTLYIILGTLGVQKEELFSIEYETRKDSANYLKGIIKCNTNSNGGEDNIDYYHMKNAKAVIDTWKPKRGETFSKEIFKEKLLNQVKFIWYESAEKDSIKVFTRLNIGKIALTNSELIKALFLNRSNFQTNEKEQVVFRQSEIANEWDEIEYTLQNDEFWYFLHDTSYNRPTRIDFIFDLMCDQNILELKIKEEKIGTDSYKTFRYFSEYFQNCNDKQEGMDGCWKEVKKYYMTFKEWYNDLELYHYVGFLIHTDKHKLNELMKEWRGSDDKEKFLDNLKTRISVILTNAAKDPENGTLDLDFQYNVDGSNKHKCKPILLFHNIQTVINQNLNKEENEKYRLGVFYKFPFHLYKLEKWDVEHINPSTPNELQEEKDRKEWLLNMYIDSDEDIQENIENYFNSVDESTKEPLFTQIKEIFPEPKEWTDEEKNKIWNYALLDSATNRSYGNALFSGKRRVIISKDKGVIIPLPQLKENKIVIGEETKATSPFVPPCTRQIFLKYYSSIIGDSNSWTKSDAEAYKKDIQACIDKLTEKDGK